MTKQSKEFKNQILHKQTKWVKSVDNAINEILCKKISISILINNAGAWIDQPYLTADGLDAQWEANYLAPFYFTNKLLDNIINTSKKTTIEAIENKQFDCRIINVASHASRRASIDDFDAFFSNNIRGDLNYWKTRSSFNVYGDTKLAQIMHAKKLQEIIKNKYECDDVLVLSLHPGVIATGFIDNFLGGKGLVVKLLYCLIGPFLETFTFLNVKQGAQTTLHCAISNDNVEGGKFHSNCRVSDVDSRAKKIVQTKCDQLYAVSSKIMVKLNFD